MPIIVANWKSHKTTTQVDEWFQAMLADWWQHQDQVQVVVAPPAALLGQVAQKLADLPEMQLGAQDCSPFPVGAYTGAVAASTLVSVGVKVVIVGHSERRQYFHETNQDVANKIAQALEAGLTPLVCVDQPYLAAQLAAIPDEHKAKCWWAYEPLEAIGLGVNQPVAEVEPVVKELRAAVGQAPILYGGSVSAANIAEYLTICQGALVGGKSLEPRDFEALIVAVQ